MISVRSLENSKLGSVAILWEWKRQAICVWKQKQLYQRLGHRVDRFWDVGHHGRPQHFTGCVAILGCKPCGSLVGPSARPLTERKKLWFGQLSGHRRRISLHVYDCLAASSSFGVLVSGWAGGFGWSLWFDATQHVIRGKEMKTLHAHSHFPRRIVSVVKKWTWTCL